MNRNTDRRKNRIIPLVAFSLSAVVLLTGIVSIATSGAKAKYKTGQVVGQTPTTVTVDADLADSLEVKEHAVTRQASGEYTLDTALTTENTYHLMPGVDIPKDPKVYVTGKTEIPAYLYIEVVDSTGLGNTFSYTLDSKWTALSVTGRNRGTVYAYETKLQKTDADYPDYVIPVFSPEKVTVSWNIDLSGIGSDAKLEVYAYMVQAVDGKTAVELYNSQLANP